MAIIQYTGIVNQIRGKLNGSVFNKARNVNTLQRKQQAPRRNVGFQSEVRNIFSEAQRTWKTLTPTQQADWALTAVNNPSRDRFGELVALSGYNQFIKAYMFAVYANQTPPIVPFTSPAPAPNTEITDIESISFDIGVGGNTVITYDVGGTQDPAASGFAFIFDVGLPISRGVTVYYGRYTNVVGIAVSSPTFNASGEQDLGTRYPLPQAGQRVSVRGRIVHIDSGAVVQQLVLMRSIF